MTVECAYVIQHFLFIGASAPSNSLTVFMSQSARTVSTNISNIRHTVSKQVSSNNNHLTVMVKRTETAENNYRITINIINVTLTTFLQPCVWTNFRIV